MNDRPYNESFKFQPLAGRDVDLHPQNARYPWRADARVNGHSAGSPPIAPVPEPSVKELSREIEAVGTAPNGQRPPIRRSADGRVEESTPTNDALIGPEFNPEYNSEADLHIERRTPTVLVVDSRGALSQALVRAAEHQDVEPEILLLQESSGTADAVDDHEPDVLMIAPADLTQATMDSLAGIYAQHPTVVTVLSDTEIPWTPAQMVASGARDILPADPAPETVQTVLARALQTAASLRGHQVLVTERIVVQKIESPLPPMPAQSAPEGRVFTITSPTGGSGKTFLASNLAAYLVRASGKKVLLVDLDMQFGSLTSSLHLHPKRTIDHLVKEEGELEPVLMDHLVEHKSGCRVLCAPSDPLAGEWTGPHDVTRILEAARDLFDYIVVDSPPTLSETCLAAFDQSEALLVVANMDVPSLKNLRRFLEALEALKIPKTTRQHLVINRADKGMGIELAQVEPLFPQGFLAVLPSSDTVRTSINNGVPLLYERPDSEISHRLADGFMKLVPVGTASPGAPSGKSGRFGRKKVKS